MNSGGRNTQSSVKGSETALLKAPPYVLRLFISGATPRSIRAIENIKKICEEHLPGRHELEVIDIYQQPDIAVREQIVAVPTLIKKLPLPPCKLIGDLSDTTQVLQKLGLGKK
jgi:circadian clock protein KaiB